MDYSTIVSDQIITKTIESLKKANINALVVDTKEQAKDKVLAMLPKGAEVMTMTSVTLQDTGILDALDKNSDLILVKNELKQLDREKDHRKMQQIGAAPEYAIGSVHAVTQDGKVMVASNTGSQLPAYVYGADHVIWVVGVQKIVKDIDEGMKRIYEYVLPLESDRAKKAYGMERSNVSKLLIFNKEVVPGRINLIFVKEKLGF